MNGLQVQMIAFHRRVVTTCFQSTEFIKLYKLQL